MSDISGPGKMREEYKAAWSALTAIETARQKLLEPTDAAHRAAEALVDEIEERIGAGPYVGRCPSCEMPVFDKDKSYPNVDEDPYCAACAPTWDDFLASDSFVDADEVPLTAEQRREQYDAHIADGGKPTDSMAR